MSNQPINLFEEIKKLNFPPSEFIVIGSGIMAAKGLRPAYDLDIVVSKELFEKCKKDKEKWELRPWTKKGKIGKEWLKGDIADLMTEINYKGVDLEVYDLIREGENIDGIDFLSLEQLKKFKKTYGRPKDFEDIEMIDKYLQDKSKGPGHR